MEAYFDATFYSATQHWDINGIIWEKIWTSEWEYFQQKFDVEIEILVKTSYNWPKFIKEYKKSFGVNVYCFEKLWFLNLLKVSCFKM